MIIFQSTLASLAFQNAFLFMPRVLETDFHCRTLSFIFRDHDNETTVTQDDGNLIFPSVKFSSHFFFLFKVGARMREYLKTLIQINFYPFLSSISWFLTSKKKVSFFIFFFFDLFWHGNKRNYVAQCRMWDAIILILQIKNAHNSCSKFIFSSSFFLFSRKF